MRKLSIEGLVSHTISGNPVPGVLQSGSWDNGVGSTVSWHLGILNDSYDGNS